MRTSSSNMRRLRAGLMGSISAWLPSRRSTALHCGACVMTVSGHVRSVSETSSTSSANGRYRWAGIDEPFCLFHDGWSGRPGLEDGVKVDDDETKASAGFITGALLPDHGLWNRTGTTRSRDGEPVRLSGPRRGTQEGARAACGSPYTFLVVVRGWGS